ncbi:hypothetical protein C4D60_Mb09t12790 [Musa balbisiana]|uniref:Uncharacterized protein n=1 Tax=Musa balbisiana TaxID=52838 RepID=A0A4S8IFY2_MUSBA|nr:hypothetical protein C4D60_Mb09t12790 [Musa balbisiana]
MASFPTRFAEFTDVLSAGVFPLRKRRSSKLPLAIYSYTRQPYSGQAPRSRTMFGCLMQLSISTCAIKGCECRKLRRLSLQEFAILFNETAGKEEEEEEWLIVFLSYNLLSPQMVNSSTVWLSIISGMLSNFSPSSETIDHSSFSPLLGGWYTLGYATSSIPDCD